MSSEPGSKTQGRNAKIGSASNKCPSPSEICSIYPSVFVFSGNKKKGIKSSIGRLFGKKDKPQPMTKDGQMTPPVIPGQHIHMVFLQWFS